MWLTPTQLAGFRRPQPINDLKCLPSIDRAPIRRTRKTGNRNVSFHSLLILDPDCRVYPFIFPWRELFLPPISPSSTHPFRSYLLFFFRPQSPKFQMGSPKRYCHNWQSGIVFRLPLVYRRFALVLVCMDLGIPDNPLHCKIPIHRRLGFYLPNVLCSIPNCHKVRRVTTYCNRIRFSCNRICPSREYTLDGNLRSKLKRPRYAPDEIQSLDPGPPRNAICAFLMSREDPKLLNS